MNLAGNLKKLRKAKKLTQSELAKQLNVSTSTIAMYETAKREPDYKTLAKIANFFEVSIEQLLDIDNKTTPKSISLDTLSEDEADLILYIRRKWSKLTKEQKQAKFKLAKHSIGLLEKIEEEKNK
ncbi:MAG TPA: helix-turn-helix transcriptional regulator [Bacillota bacterium]|nr:helix-turn-helix transcriptional regulator [Bacillota bacterium]